MKTTLASKNTESAPQTVTEAAPLEKIHLLYACGAMTVKLSDCSIQTDFASGAVGATDVEVFVHGRFNDGMMSLPANTGHPLVKGNVLFVPDTRLMDTQLEVSQRLLRSSPSSEVSELALARLLQNQTVEGVMYGGVIHYWHKKLQFARVTAAGTTLVTFDTSQ